LPNNRGPYEFKGNRFPSDKRKGFSRVDFREDVNFSPVIFASQGEDLRFTAQAKDLSSRGIYLEVNREGNLSVLAHLKVSSLIWVSFYLPGLDLGVKIQGEIKRVRPAGEGALGLGIMFINLSSRNLSIIKKFVRSRLES